MTKKLKARPVGTKMLVLPDPAKERITDSGLIIPLTANSQLEEATVVLVSDDVQLYIEVGDRVLYPRNTGVEHELEGVKYKFINGPTTHTLGDVWAIL